MHGKKSTIFLVLVLLFSLCTSGCMEQAQEQQQKQHPQGTGQVQVTDMKNRSISVPANITTAVTTYPPVTILVYMLAPEKLAGWNFINKFNHTLMDEKYLNLPVVGGWYGTQTGNYETMSSIHPDLVLSYGVQDDVIQRHQEMFGSIPVIAIDESVVFLRKSDPSIEFAGKLLGAEERAGRLIKLRASVLGVIDKKVATIPNDKKVRVYYAEGSDGLATDPSGSSHSQLIEICGGINVADCPLTPGIGMTPVSMEQVMRWKPDVIITNSQQFYSTVYSDPLWSNLEAVKNKRVYLSPTNPFCWIDRPPGPHLILGTAWTAHCLYPELFADLDMNKLTREFYADFYHYELTDEELAQLLNPQIETKMYKW